MGKFQQVDQIAGHLIFFVKPLIKCLFNQPRRIAEKFKIHHAAAALQRMKATPNCRQRFDVRIIRLAALNIFNDVGQNFIRFFQENIQ